MKLITTAMSYAFVALVSPSIHAAQNSTAPDLDLRVEYYSKTLTVEGVTRETRYAESMLRRANHVWVSRELPQTKHTHAGSGHKHFNPALWHKHVVLEQGQPRLEYVDLHDKTVVAVPAAEYANVSFDGSWENSFYLFTPRQMHSMQARPAEANGQRWYVRESTDKQGEYARVLWDPKLQIPVRIEVGKQDGSAYSRVEIKVLPKLNVNLPWQNLRGFAHKEYADFLD